METLIYNAGNLRYEIPQKPLDDLIKERVCLIEDLNKIQKALNKGPVGIKQFEQLMGEPIDVLRNYVFDQQAVLNRHHYDQRANA